MCLPQHVCQMFCVYLCLQVQLYEVRQFQQEALKVLSLPRSPDVTTLLEQLAKKGEALGVIVPEVEKIQMVSLFLTRKVQIS